MEKTKDINMPLESKYWKLEKDLQKNPKQYYSFKLIIIGDLENNKINTKMWTNLQFMAANSFKCSALYTRPTKERGNVSMQKISEIYF